MAEGDWKMACSHASYRFHKDGLTIRGIAEEVDSELFHGKIYQTFSPSCVDQLERHWTPDGRLVEELRDMIIMGLGHVLIAQATLNVCAVRLFDRSGVTPLITLDMILANTTSTIEMMNLVCGQIHLGEAFRRTHEDENERLRKMIGD